MQFQGKLFIQITCQKAFCQLSCKTISFRDPICWFYRDNNTHMKTALMSSTPGFCVAPKLSPSSKLKWITEEVQLFFKSTLTASEPFIYTEYKQTMLLLIQFSLSWQCPVCILKNNILFNKVHIPLIISIIPLWIEHLSKQTPDTRKKNERPLKESSSQAS